MTVAPVTTTVRDIASEVVLGAADGMPADCAINCDHIQTVAKDKVGKLIAPLSEPKRRQLTRAIRFALDL